MMDIYKTANDRYILARWDERQAQYIGHAVPPPDQGYHYTFGRSVEALARLGVPTYATLSTARRALARRYGPVDA